MPDTTPIYDPNGTVLAVLIGTELWWPEDLQLFYPELLHPATPPATEPAAEPLGADHRSPGAQLVHAAPDAAPAPPGLSAPLEGRKKASVG